MSITWTNKGLRICTMVVVLFVAFVLTSCSKGGTAPLQKVTFMAGYQPQADLPFVAAYVAKENGYFADEGLDVTILHSTHNIQPLMAGSVDITTADANSVLKLRTDSNLPVVAIALFGQKGQQAYITVAKSGINTVKDFAGKTFGYKTTVPPDFLAMLKANGVDPSTVKEVPVGYDPRVLTEGKVDILAVFKSNEPYTVRQLGYDINVFDPADYGVPTMGLTYITTQQLVDKDPQMLERFIKATMKGMEFAYSNPEEAINIVMKYAPTQDRNLMKFMMSTEEKDATNSVIDKNGFGWMTREQWQAFEDSLLKYNALSKSVDVNTVFTDKFLQEAYNNGKLRWP